MKKQSLNSFAPLSKTLLQSLTTEVKETIAPDHTLAGEKIFTVAEYWNIQRNRRQTAKRRYLV